LKTATRTSFLCGLVFIDTLISFLAFVVT